MILKVKKIIMNFKRLTFINDVGLSLSGRMDLPSGDVYHNVILFAHCFTCGKNVNSAAYISRFLTARGFGVFRFDFTGLGESQGDFSETNFDTNVRDLISAANFLKQNFKGPGVMIGHSLGGTAAIQAAVHLPAVKAVITIGSPADPQHLLTHIKEATCEIESKGEAVVDLAGRRFKLKKQFIEDLKQSKLDAALKNLNKAILVMHSPTDDTVGIDQAGIIFGKARHPKSFVSLNGADHLLARKQDAEYAADVISAWVMRYLEETGKY